MALIFLYGTLCHRPLLAEVLGHEPRLIPARALGWRIAAAAGEVFPLILPAPGEAAEGELLDAAGDDRARLDFYELGFGYDLAPVTVETAEGPAAAQLYRARPGLWQEAGPWSLEDFAAQRGALNTGAARGFMALWPRTDPAEAARRYPQILQRAASARRAAADPGPRGPRLGRGAVEVLRNSRPYSAFFEVADCDLRFPRFDGSRSEVVSRAAFVMADAVTVLPYDPVRDRVLLVEQFRFGPFMRGDPLPWTLEPIAGRMDGDEPPEETARREAREEAGLELGALIPAGRYYPSPGAVTEYVWSFIGLADLPDSAAATGGLESEAEDIRGHLVPFGEAMAMCRDGRIQTGPLILSVLWLAGIRDGLRAGRVPAG